MPWYSHLLLVCAVGLATVASWAGIAVEMPDWVPYRVEESLQLLAMGAPFLALGWALDRLDVDRPAYRVAVAYIPILALAVATGVLIGWGWEGPGRGVFGLGRDIAVFAGLGLVFSGFVLVIGVLATGVGVWLSRNVRREVPPVGR